MQIRFYNRKSQQIEIEKVYGDSFVNWAYKNTVGAFFTRTVFSKKWVSQAMGLYQNSAASKKAIAPFIEQYKIPMQEFESTKYDSFNDFFIRKFKPGVRAFDADKNIFSAGAEARYLVIENLNAYSTFPVKGITINLAKLMGSTEIANHFLGGTLLIARLCPVDYHRFHFPVAGKIELTQTLHGAYHSVNPVALEALPSVLFQNERCLTLMKNEVFGKVAMIEVGALGVGKIVQSQKWAPSLKFDKGQEKGYFLFGGSTVIWVLQKGALTLDADLVHQSSNGIETWVPLGDRLGERKTEST